jgi:hypothetical protein
MIMASGMRELLKVVTMAGAVAAGVGAVGAVTMAGCADEGAPPAGGTSDVGQLALTSGSTEGVAGFQFDVRSSDGVPVASRFVPGGDTASTFFVLAPGDYFVTATAMAAPDVPVPGCAPDFELATVQRGQTTRLMLVAFCEGAGRGGLGATARTDRAPEFTSLSFEPTTPVAPCEVIRVDVAATDPDGDPVEFLFSVGGGDPFAIRYFATSLDALNFTASRAGSYDLEILACDGHGCVALDGLTLELVGPPQEACEPPPAP